MAIIDHTALQPLDEHNQVWADYVHPAGWQNPMPEPRYDLVVIGAGPAGLVIASAASALGASVALVEKALMGGDCLNVGCVPSKALIRAGRAWADAKSSDQFGYKSNTAHGDFAEVMRRLRQLRSQLSEHDSVDRFSKLSVDVFLGSGKFISRDAVMVGTQELKFRRAVITTGARAAIPDIPGLSDTGYFTNETIFTLTSPPARLVIIGAGPIGCEMAQAFARLGSSVTILTDGPRIMPREDLDAAAAIHAALERDGVQIINHVKIKEVRKFGEDIIIALNRHGQANEVVTDALLIATGRTPNIELLNLPAAGVTFKPHDGVLVNDYLRTANGRIYAAGDVCSKYKFTHTADAMARIVIRNALFFGRQRVSKLVIPWCTYTDPELAHVQLATGLPTNGVQTIRINLSEIDRAVLDGQDDGFLKVYLREGSDRILGATLVASHAGEMISEITLAMNNGIGLGKIASVIHPYPTQAAVIKQAADVYNRGRLTPQVRKLLKLILKIG